MVAFAGRLAGRVYVYFGNVQHWRIADVTALNADASAIIKRAVKRAAS